MLGALSGEQGSRLERLAELLSAVSPVAFTGNLRGARWSKLAMNCAISTLGTVGQPGGATAAPPLRPKARDGDLHRGVPGVARAEGVRVEKVASTVDLEWLTLGESEQRAGGSLSLVARHVMLMAIGARYRRLRSSMLAAIERGASRPWTTSTARWSGAGRSGSPRGAGERAPAGGGPRHGPARGPRRGDAPPHPRADPSRRPLTRGAPARGATGGYEFAPACIRGESARRGCSPSGTPDLPGARP